VLLLPLYPFAPLPRPLPLLAQGLLAMSVRLFRVICSLLDRNFMAASSFLGLLLPGKGAQGAEGIAGSQSKRK